MKVIPGEIILTTLITLSLLRLSWWNGTRNGGGFDLISDMPQTPGK